MNVKLDRIISEVFEVVVTHAIPNSYEYKLELRNVIAEKYNRTRSMEAFSENLNRNILFFICRINLYSDYIYHWFRNNNFPSQHEMIQIDETIREMSLKQIDGIWTNEMQKTNDYYANIVPIQRRITALEDGYSIYSTQHSLMVDFCHTLIKNRHIIQELYHFQPSEIIDKIKSILAFQADLIWGNIEISVPMSQQKERSVHIKKKSADKIGNYYSNIFAYYHAKFAENEKYIFSYVSRNGVSGIYRNTKGKNDHICLIQGEFSCINVVDEWVYYYDCNFDGIPGIYRIKIDGSKKELIDREYSEHFIVVNDWIYYIRANNIGIFNNVYKVVLYKIKTNGTGKKIIDIIERKTPNYWGDNIAYWDGYIYFAKKDGIWRIKTDGTKKERIINIKPSGWVFHDGYHYIKISDEAELYRFDLDGKNQKFIFDDFYGTNIHTNGKYIVWVEMIDKDSKTYAIFKTDMNGNNREKIVTKNSFISDVHILKEGVYYLFNNQYYFINP